MGFKVKFGFALGYADGKELLVGETDSIIEGRWLGTCELLILGLNDRVFDGCIDSCTDGIALCFAEGVNEG